MAVILGILATVGFLIFQITNDPHRKGSSGPPSARTIQTDIVLKPPERKPLRPKLTAVSMQDPRYMELRQVGLLAFGDPTRQRRGKRPSSDGTGQNGPNGRPKDPSCITARDRWEHLTGSVFLSNAYDLGEGMELQPPNGANKSFRNAEAAYLSLRFWEECDVVAQLDAFAAKKKIEEIEGRREASRFYAGYRNKWKSMWGVLEAKFKGSSEAEIALLARATAGMA